MNVLFDKAVYTESHASVETAEGAESSSSSKVESADEEGKSIEIAIKESLASGKVGALSVDPNYLEFEPLASEYCTWLECPLITLCLSDF